MAFGVRLTFIMQPTHCRTLSILTSLPTPGLGQPEKDPAPPPHTGQQFTTENHWVTAFQPSVNTSCRFRSSFFSLISVVPRAGGKARDLRHFCWAFQLGNSIQPHLLSPSVPGSMDTRGSKLCMTMALLFSSPTDANGHGTETDTWWSQGGSPPAGRR